MAQVCPLPPERGFVTPAEFARETGYNLRAVQRWCERGWIATLPYPGQRWRIPRSELERYLTAMAKLNPPAHETR